jgi:hypothetical protein
MDPTHVVFMSIKWSIREVDYVKSSILRVVADVR